MVTKLPRLFDIFSPSTCRKPLCIQTLAMRVGAEGAAGLRDLVLVMGKDEIDSAAVNVEDIAARVVALQAAAERLEQRRHRHRRALDMPAGAPRRGDAGRARPARLVRLRGLPQDEVHRVALVRRDIDARAGQHLVERAMRERPVARRPGQRVHRIRREQHVILGDIGDAARDQPLDHHPHRVDILGGARLVRRRQRAESGHVFVKLPLGRFRHFGDRLVERQVGKVARGARVDLVVDVGDVADVDDMVGAIEVAQEPEQHVEHDDRPGVADMGEVVDRGPADIETHRLRVDRREILLAAGEGVVETQPRLRRLRGRLVLGSGRRLHRQFSSASFRKGERTGVARVGRMIASRWV